MELAIAILGAAALAAAVFALRLYLELQKMKLRYAPNIDADQDLRAAKEALERTRREEQDVIAAISQKRAESERELARARSDHEYRCAALAAEYERAQSTYTRLKHEVSLLEENLEDISFGLYKPHFKFDTSEEYKTQLEEIRNRQKELVRQGRAALCAIVWTVGESKREGARMTKQYLKLMLRAFNGECDAAVANVSWNNVTKMEERIKKTHASLNELGGVMQMSITQEYLNLRLVELHLAHEYEDKKHQEKEEQRRIREQIREEERAQREFEQAQEEAQLEEVRFQKALERAREEAARATGAQLQKLSDQIASFEAKLDEARKKKERAISRAQLTKSGFIYVISSVGSFGEKVLKIGMTRRLEPMERVKELGDASVPFGFDVHAMLYSDDAPKLESELHQFLDDRRVNLVNPRKEFYQDVELAEVEKFVRDKGLSAQFIKIPEAREYRETLAMRAEKQKSARVTQGQDAFPPALFGAPRGAPEPPADTAAAKPRLHE